MHKCKKIILNDFSISFYSSFGKHAKCDYTVNMFKHKHSKFLFLPQNALTLIMVLLSKIRLEQLSGPLAFNLKCPQLWKIFIFPR